MDLNTTALVLVGYQNDYFASHGILRGVLAEGMVTSLCIDSTGRAAYERGYRGSILSGRCSAPTRSEQDFFCEQNFPLDACGIDSRQWMEKRLNPEVR